MLLRMRLSRGTRTTALGTLLLVGLIVQIAALPLSGTDDVRVFREWGVFGLSQGLFGVYAAPVSPPPDHVPPDYPPLSLALLTSVAGAMEFAVGRADVDSRQLTFYIKLLTLIARLLMLGLILWVAMQSAHDGLKAVAVAAAFWINPALWLNGPVLGYLDALCWLPGTAAVICASRGHLRAAAALAIVAMLIKPQGVFFVLPVAIAAWGHPARVSAAVSAAVIAGGAIVAPFVLFSGPADFAQAMLVNIVEDMLSGGALNLWWLATLAFHGVEHGWQVVHADLQVITASQFAALTGVEPKWWMAAILVGSAAWLAWLMRGLAQLPALAAYLALVLHAYFVFAVSVHENHQVYAIVMLGLVAVFEPAYRGLLVATSGVAACNMVLFHGFGRDVAASLSSGLFFWVTAVLSLANVALMAVHARLFRDLYRRAKHEQAPADPGSMGLARAGSRLASA